MLQKSITFSSFHLSLTSIKINYAPNRHSYAKSNRNISYHFNRKLLFIISLKIPCGNSPHPPLIANPLKNIRLNDTPFLAGHSTVFIIICSFIIYVCLQTLFSECHLFISQYLYCLFNLILQHIIQYFNSFIRFYVSQRYESKFTCFVYNSFCYFFIC